MNPETTIHSPHSTNSRHSSDEIDLREMLVVLWKGRLWIMGATFIASFLSVVVALWLPDIYRSEALLVADDENGGVLAGLASQYGGLASLAGISLPSGGSSGKAIGIETLKSRQFIADFIERRSILPELMATKDYDPSTKSVDYDEDIYNPEEEIWLREAKPPYQAKPSDQEAYEEFMLIYNVAEDAETGFVRVSIEHYSPVLAQQWVTWLVEDINSQMVSKAIGEAERAIEFLSDQLGNTQSVALQQVFYSLIEEQTKTIMLANVRPEYLFETIDPAVEPEEKSKPMRALICILGAMLGGLLGSLTVLIKYYTSARLANNQIL